MFPISCNAFGDIVAVVQIVRDIVVALDDARGAAEEYKQFIHVLSALGAVMDGVYCLAKDSHDEHLKQIVLEEVHRCCVDINSAHSSIARFEKLEEGSTRESGAGRIIAKLHWHFLKASDAAKYAKRFGESHQRLNTYIGLLSHHSTSQIIEVQHLRSLQAAQDHNLAVLQAVRNQEHTILQSSDEMKTFALSAIQQASLQSRQHIVEQVLTRPFLASAQDRRVASRVQRVTDVIFDSLASHTPAAQRERFLSLVAPVLIAGAALVAYTHVSSQWHSTVFLPAVCALLVQVLWLQSSTPLYPGFSCENAILLVGFFGESITVPFQFCRSFEMFHGFLDLLYSGYEMDTQEFVRLRLYELYLGGTSQLISFSNWSCCILPGTCLEMGIVLIPDANHTGMCPYCEYEYADNPSHEVICAACSSRFWKTTEPLVFTNYAGSWAGAVVLQRRHSTNISTELSQMNTPLTSSLSVAQYHQSPSALPYGAFWRRCSRVHVVNMIYGPSYTPEDIQSGSKMLMDTLLSEETSSRRRSVASELLRSYVDLIEDLCGGPDDNDLNAMRAYKFTYDDARQNIGGQPGYGQYFRGPMTVEEQLLVRMVSTLDAFITEPSRAAVRRWEELVNGYSPEFLSLDESQRVDELLKDHESIGGYFHCTCEYFNLQ